MSLPGTPKAHFAVAGRHLTEWGHVLYKPATVHVHNPWSVVYTSWSKLVGDASDFPAFQAAVAAGTFTPAKFQGGAILIWPSPNGGTTFTGTPSGGEALAVDMGEPGRSDFFEVAKLPGAAGGGLLQGGNIQMHGKCPVTL
jgi:hypothetical protein